MKNKHSRIWAAVFMSILIAVSTVLTAVGHIDKAQAAEKAVSYTHLTLPTKLEV